KTARKDVLDRPEIVAAEAAARARLDASGRLLVRASGTEPLIRIMVEGDDRATIEQIAHGLASRIAQAAEPL
ncbi:MAG TPA: hypothetical protein VIJ12_11555, partial [Candidatus Baltobacteraceae bacterium]